MVLTVLFSLWPSFFKNFLEISTVEDLENLLKESTTGWEYFTNRKKCFRSGNTHCYIVSSPHSESKI